MALVPDWMATFVWPVQMNVRRKGNVWMTEKRKDEWKKIDRGLGR